ncbi:glycogen debranching protein GlgX [Actinobaculum sp. 313]|uniref:glycogen debranching protein GlgX n=1 Tax=Actinobaculum sp. 313 TaxID=2495645 RepID=UPI001F0CA409|nr:glycogen debranching protein GlgX [Actinobaculum sp. 313]
MTTLTAALPLETRYTPRDPEPTSRALSMPVQLGAHLAGDGADFALRAPHASAVHLCLIDSTPAGLVERRFALRSQLGTWSGHVSGVTAGQRYGYRVFGRWSPESGLIYNPAKLLLDPYARAVTGSPVLAPALYAHRTDDALTPLSSATLEEDDRDSAPYMAYGVVVPENTMPIRHPYTAWDRTVIYEAHVKGLTKLSPDLPEELRGTYAGLGHPATVSYLKNLGITAIELLPIHAKMSEPFLTRKGLVNYWGYNTLNFFSPEPSYATQAAQEAGAVAVLNEVRSAINSLHDAGIEVILDVVYNHTCEAGITGPTVSWRGIDQPSYYMQAPDNPGQLLDTTGCGNSLDFRRQTVLKMTLDSLRYWVTEMGVDGFRFDLAVTLGRNGEQFDTHHPFYMALTTDPVLSTVKLINEPWDLGPNGWQTGRFPLPTADWNDHFRDTTRAFWLGQPRMLMAGGQGGDLRDIATRLAGSADLFGHGRVPGGRGAYASINFVTAHDGFTLRDLVSFDSKHNEANLEDNRDGTNDNKSWNHGWEGIGQEGDEPPRTVRERRRLSMRNLLGTLILATGTPMITAGDEIGRSQQGNNNSYCQDNELSWVDWELEEWQRDQLETTSYLLRLRHEHRVLRPKHFFSDGPGPLDPVSDLTWLDASGHPMPDHAWFDSSYRTLQMLRSGQGRDVDALIVFNGSLSRAAFTIPEGRGTSFKLVWDSSWPRPRRRHEVYAPGASTSMGPLSMRLYLANPQ